MGMSSSQARLLSLTARMHDIEYKAQRLEAQKLQLANESDKAYEDYLNVLEAKKIQYRLIQSDGSLTYRDANMNILQNGSIPGYTQEHSADILFLQDQDGKIMVTPSVANEFGLTTWAENMPMDDYIKQVTGKDKVETPIYKTVTVDDTSKIASFTPIVNTLVSEPSENISHTYSAVANEEGGIDYEALSDYAVFNANHSTSTAGATSIGTGSSITAGGKYTINSAAELKALMDNATAENTAGTTFILTNDIDLSGISWSGIQNFAGTFDGNGYTIKNLTGSQGLFASTNKATIQNVGLENINITGTSNVGGLIGSATQTDITNCYTTGTINCSGNNVGGLVGTQSGSGECIKFGYNKVYSNVNVKGSSDVGGLIGHVQTGVKSAFDLTNCYAIGNVTGTTNVGGLIGYAYYDEDSKHFSTPDITDIRNAYAGGNVTGTDSVGGFFGFISYWGDGDDYCEIEKCQSSGKVNGTGSAVGAFAGTIKICLNEGAGWNSEAQKYVNFISCGYSSSAGPAKAYGAIYDENNNDQSALVQNSGSTSGLVQFNMAGSIPSIEADGSGAYMSNILGVLTKAGVFDACDESTEDVAALKSKIANFINSFSNNNTDNAKLWYLNVNMVNYLNSGSESDKALAEALFKDINNGTKSNTASYQIGDPLTGKVGRGAGEEWTPDGTHTIIQGKLNIPSINTIADEVYYAMKKKDSTLTLTAADVRSWFNSKYGSLTNEDKITLANINDKLSTGGDLSALFLAIIDNTARVDYTDNYNDPEKWTITVATTDKTIGFTYGTKEEEQFDHNEYAWDTTDPEIAQAMSMWILAQRGIVVVTEEQASSKDFLKNMIEVGGAALTTFNPAAVEKLLAYDTADILAMDDSEYNELMGIKNTCLSVEPRLIETEDPIGVKKAEADYEAKMRLIDRKDRKYDTELAAVETERSAIKQEMDTLKTVAKDNTDRTFKLFS